MNDRVFLRRIHNGDVELAVLVRDVGERAEIPRLPEALRRLTRFLVVVGSGRVNVDGERANEPGGCDANASEVGNSSELANRRLEPRSLIFV